MNLKNRTQKFINDLGLPVSRFCKLARISTGAYYQWLKDEIRFKPETEQRIKNILEKYNG